MVEDLWSKAVTFHGHICPGIAVGFRASVYALNLLGYKGEKFSDSYNVVVENDVCGNDGVQIVTGCTTGNDGLIIDNKGKQAFNFISKKTARGIRLVLNVPLWESDEPIYLHQKVKGGISTEQEKKSFFAFRHQRGLQIMNIPDEQLFKVADVELVLPKKPRLYPFVKCSVCKEEVMTPWASEFEGNIICAGCKRLNQ